MFRSNCNEPQWRKMLSRKGVSASVTIHKFPSPYGFAWSSSCPNTLKWQQQYMHIQIYSTVVVIRKQRGVCRLMSTHVSMRLQDTTSRRYKNTLRIPYSRYTVAEDGTELITDQKNTGLNSFFTRGSILRCGQQKKERGERLNELNRNDHLIIFYNVSILK